MATQCDRCKGEHVEMKITSTRQFDGGILTVNDVPARKCDCEVLTSLPDGVIGDGYKWMLEENGVIGIVTVSLGKLKERFSPMDFIRPHLKTETNV